MSVVEDTQTLRAGTIGDSPARPDGISKVQGGYAFSSDLSADGCLFGAMTSKCIGERGGDMNM